MSTDETLPTRRPKPASADPASQAPTEVRPAFEPPAPPAAQPSFQPARPSFQPADEPAYRRSAEPQTVQADALRPGPAQAGAPPRPGFTPGGEDQPTQQSPQYGKSPYESAEQYGATARFEETERFEETARFSAGGGQYGMPPTDTPQYGSAQYGRETGYDDQPPAPPAGRQSRPRRRKRRIIMSVFTVVVVLVVLLVGDWVARLVAQYEIASQITQADSANIQNTSVSIKGWPFLTQVATRDLQQIDISTSVKAGPVSGISVSAVAKGIHINGSFNGGEVDSISGTASVPFSSLQSALMSESQGIANVSLSPAGSDGITASVNVAGANLITETGKIAITGSKVTVDWSQSGNGGGGILGSILGSSGTLSDLTFTLPKLPAGLEVKSFTVNSAGVSLTVAGSHAMLSQ